MESGIDLHDADSECPRSGTFRTTESRAALSLRPPANVRFDRAMHWSLSRGVELPSPSSIKLMLDAEGRGRI